jgi:hypothetical protein
MKIEIKMLSKEALVDLLSAIHTGRPFPDDVFTALYTRDLERQVNGIARRLKGIEKKLENRKLPRKAYSALIKKQNSLAVLGNKKIEILKELDNDKAAKG